MSIQREFEMFHYHASCAANYAARFALAIISRLLNLALRGIDYLYSRVTEPIKPEVNYEIHVQ